MASIGGMAFRIIGQLTRLLTQRPPLSPARNSFGGHSHEPLQTHLYQAHHAEACPAHNAHSRPFCSKERRAHTIRKGEGEMTDIALIETQKTFLPLMAVQQRSRGVGYQMPVRAHQSAAEATAAGIAARRRLMTGPAAIAAPKPSPAAGYIQNKPMETFAKEKGKAPLDMLLEPSSRFLIKLACIRHGVSQRNMMGKSRNVQIAAARHDAIGLVYQHTKNSMPAVGRLFKRDHTTVLHSLRKLGRDAKLIDKIHWPDEILKPVGPMRRDATGRFLRGSRRIDATT